MMVHARLHEEANESDVGLYANNVPQHPYVHMICTKFNQLSNGKLHLVSILPKLSEIHLD